MPHVSQSDAHQLQVGVQAFVRTFGLLVTRQTPCGQPVSPSYAHALMFLLEREASGLRTAQSELADALGLDKSSVARLCQRLEADERVEQQPAPEDARSRQLTLTARGRKMAKNLQAASLDRFQRILAGIPSTKRRGIIASLELLTDAVGKLGKDPP